MKSRTKVFTAFIGLMLIGQFAMADQTTDQTNKGNADVVAVQARQTGAKMWSFSVSIAHPDTGWQAYADGWDIVLPNGMVSKPNASEQFTRTLWHPHVNEQPFTRAQSGVAIPEDVDEVLIRAHDKPDGFGGKTMRLDLKPLRKQQ